MPNESTKQSTTWMNKAVSLMMQLKVPPTPYNYGIWYEYVSNRNKKLNQLMDDTLHKLGKIPNFLSRDFFHDFIVDYKPDNNTPYGNIQKIAKLTSTLDVSSSRMNHSLSDLDSVLKKSRLVLKRTHSEEHLDKVINYLDQGSRKTLEAVNQFANELNQAQNDIQKLKKEISELKKQSDIDELTQLENQTALERRLYYWLSDAEDDVSVIILDIDNLERINEQFGRRAGTSLIHHLATLLQSFQLENCHVARFYGGTFGVLLNEATLDMAFDYAERLRSEVSLQKIRHKQSKENMPTVTISLGIATIVGEEDGESLLLRAQKNLKRAKEAGKNCISSH